MTTPFKLAAIATITTLVITLSACVTAAPNPSGSNSASPSGPATSTTTPDPTQADGVLGPFGYGALRLGMTKAEAKATGLTAGISADTKGGCGSKSDGNLKGFNVGEDSVSGQLFFSTTTGKLIAIYAAGDVKNLDGLGIGSTVKELKAAYPDWSTEDGDEGIGAVSVKGNPQAHFRISVSDGVILELSLDSEDQDCYE
jgi:hypothetical protein